MSTWPSDGRQEKEREEVLAEMTNRLLTAAGPEEERIHLGSKCAFSGGSLVKILLLTWESMGPE